MKTITLKLPTTLEAHLESVAKKTRVSKSEIIRRAIIYYFSNMDIEDRGSFLDLTRDLDGTLSAPEDLSINEDHFKEYDAWGRKKL